MAPEEKTRVDFNAPASLVKRADAIADLLDVSRTHLLIEALRDEIEDLAADDEFRRLIGDAYYAGEIDFDTVESILGTEAAMRMKFLRASLNRDPPEPQIERDQPSAAEFYEGEVPVWTPTDEAADRESRE
ncbi:hypothetical protein AB7C87_13600 [Natrarchaeobius sp. A-rgal3]|uniref:hypothetical protein n=1 Tax=Natrarchaeobius versutus TaxID=1679078 RepID=UPI00350E9650